MDSLSVAGMPKFARSIVSVLARLFSSSPEKILHSRNRMNRSVKFDAPARIRVLEEAIK
jgi:hypothetical protein